VVAGLSDVSVRFSKCCSPVPGDEIIGFVTRGRGVSIHRTDCVNMMNLSEADRQRIIEAEWSVDSQGSADEDYDAEIVIYAYDRMGILMDITRVLTENKIDVKAMNTRTSKQGIATINVSFAIRGVEALNELIKKLRNVPNVTDIERSRA
jgi:guanosine-3',5'-bis(diphosphate) 3'-pyrophosphohydrolase